MAEERRPFRFVIPPAEAQSFSQPGPCLFPHYQNYNYQALPTAVPHFVAATPPGNTPTSAASSSENSDNSPSEVGSKRCPNWSVAETRFLLEIWRDCWDIKCILRMKARLLLRNIARTNTREVNRKASSPAIFQN